MARIFFFSLCFFFSLVSHGQDLLTISGKVKDAQTGEGLPMAYVSIKEIPSARTVANLEGEYSLQAPPGSYTLTASYFGYIDFLDTINLKESFVTDLPLVADAHQLKELVLSGPPDIDEKLESTEMGKVELKAEEIKMLPSLMGETDLMKSLQLLPGVQASGEGNTGLYVRGGGPDQNLVLLDDAPVYNTGHLFGFFSVFNTDAIDEVFLYKGNMPPRFGGRLSSVVEFKMKEGSMDSLQGEGGIGLISSRLTVHGPIKKEKLSFLLSGRRTYLDFISKPFYQREGARGVPYYFYDLNGKISWKAGKKDSFFLSAYTGKDDIRLILFDGRFKSHINWGNTTSTLRWKHVFNEKLVQETYLIYNKFEFLSEATFDQFNTAISSSIKDVGIKLEFDYQPLKRHNIKFGTSYTFHTFTPRKADASTDSVVFQAETGYDTKYAHDIAMYIGNEFNISDKIKASIGLRYNVFMQSGPYQYVSATDTIHYSSGKIVSSYAGFEPRMAVRYKLSDLASLKTAFNVNNQYIHMVSLSGTAMPYDIWVPSSIRIKPQKGWQYSLGYYRLLKEKNYEFSVEGYYKEMENQIEYRQDYVPKISGEIEEDFVFGDGWSYGLEFFLKKRYGKLQGWIGYTWSKTLRKFSEINAGNIFPARYDRRHDLSLVGTYNLSERWTLGGTFVFGTGQAITLPERRYLISGTVYYEYSDRNAYRMQPYNRLDVSATYKNKWKKMTGVESSWTFAVYNVYNRKNPYIYYFDAQMDTDQRSLDVQAKKLWLFPIMPSVTWNFKF